MRVWHRDLGFFLSGIMAIYAVGGTVLIFRNTDFLKVEKQIEKATSESEREIVFAEGRYDKQSGLASYTKMELPLPLFFNIFFGCALLFSVVSAFFMFLPKSPTFRKDPNFEREQGRVRKGRFGDGLDPDTCPRNPVLENVPVCSQ
jgi:hypothetical protein